MAGMFVCCLGSPLTVLAAESPHVSIQTGGKLAGQFRDGDIITQVRIASQDAHSGFQFWSEAMKSGSAPNRYVVTGVQNGRNTLRVRIEKEGGQPDSTSGKGLIMRTGDEVASFNVVSDGEQTVTADSYLFDVRAASITLNATGTVEQGEPTIQTVSLDFNKQPELMHELNPVLPVFPSELADNTLLAQGVVSTQDNSEQKMAVRFVAGEGERSTSAQAITLLGQNDKSHELKVKIQLSDEVNKHEEWFVKSFAAPSLKYTINVDGQQRVPADTYSVSVGGGFWRD
ncbi:MULTISPECIES: AfaD family invasin [unclassified Erwinia]|nr:MULTISPECIES: AfaD family invasin [unclassified Erwinia]